MKSIQKLLLIVVAFGLIGGSALAESPRLFSNKRKYQDDSVKPATGRSGSAEIQAQALIGADHTAALVVSSRKVGQSEPSGNIEKIQLKISAGSCS